MGGFKEIGQNAAKNDSLPLQCADGTSKIQFCFTIDILLRPSVLNGCGVISAQSRQALLNSPA